MADFKVSQNSESSAHSVKLSSGNSFTIIQEKTVVADLLSDLGDVDVSGVGDKFVIMYNSTTGKYTAVNPDTVLSASSNTEITQPGLPNDFINTLDTDLDDKIDLDAGGF
jgi:hypothetical protein